VGEGFRFGPIIEERPGRNKRYAVGIFTIQQLVVNVAGQFKAIIPKAHGQ